MGYRFAGNKCCHRDVAERFGVAASTCFNQHLRVMKYLYHISSSVIKMPQTDEEKYECARKFERVRYDCLLLRSSISYDWQVYFTFQTGIFHIYTLTYVNMIVMWHFSFTACRISLYFGRNRWVLHTYKNTSRKTQSNLHQSASPNCNDLAGNLWCWYEVYGCFHGYSW